MKKFVSILFIIISLLNWAGYRILNSYFEDKANARLDAQLDDNNYDESQIISIKIPVVHFAYYNNSINFERFVGEIEINGIQYKYVKKRLFNDSLEFICIPNPEVMRLQSSKDEFFNLATDLQLASQGKKSSSHPNTSKCFGVHYYLNNNSFHLKSFCFSLERKSIQISSHIVPGYSITAEQPPEYC